MSTSLLLGVISQAGPPPDQAEARATTHPIDVQGPPAEDTRKPDYNGLLNPDPEPGINTKQTGSRFTPPVKSAPIVGGGDMVVLDPVNRSSNVGTAAARERAGQNGHGTMAVTEGIEPTIRDGAAFGADYFTVNPRDGVNPTTDYPRGVTPILQSAGGNVVQDAGNTGARDAKAAGQSGTVSFYAQFLAGGAR